MIAGEPTSISYTVDGVKYDGEAMDRNKAGAAVQYLKEVAGLDMNERRKPQSGTFKAALDGKKSTIQVTSFGSAQGESMRLVTNPKDRQNFKLESLGFSEDQLAIDQGIAGRRGAGAAGRAARAGVDEPVLRDAPGARCVFVSRAHG